MKTLFNIVVGLILLLSGTIVQAVDLNKIPKTKITVIITNNSAAPLTLSQYQPATVPGISSPPSPISVGQNIPSTPLTFTMLPGTSYLAFAYDQNNYCRFAFHVRGNGSFHGANVVDQQGNTHCKISMSGNSVAITFLKPQVDLIKNKTKVAVPQQGNNTRIYAYVKNASNVIIPGNVELINSCSGKRIAGPFVVGSTGGSRCYAISDNSKKCSTYAVKFTYSHGLKRDFLSGGAIMCSATVNQAQNTLILFEGENPSTVICKISSYAGILPKCRGL